MSVILFQKGEIVAEYPLMNKDGKRPAVLLGEYCEKYEGKIYEEILCQDDGWTFRVNDLPVFGY